MVQEAVSAIQIVLAIFFMIGLGMLLNKIGILPDSSAPILSDLTVRVALPCTILNSVLTSFTRQSLVASALGLGACFVSVAASMGLGILLARLIRLSPRRRGVFACMFGLSNSIFIGLPVCQALFGDSATGWALTYYIANTVMFWSLGNALMREKSAEKPPLRTVLNRLIPIPLKAFFFSVVLVLLKISLPECAMKATKLVGNLVTPLSLFYTGIIIMRMFRAGRVRWERGYSLMLAGRYVVAPGLMLMATFLFGVTGITRNVLVIQAAMPVMAQSAIVAANLGADEEYAAGGITISTALSLLFIPLYMMLLSSL